MGLAVKNSNSIGISTNRANYSSRLNTQALNSRKTDRSTAGSSVALHDPTREIDAENKVVIFDLDETLVSCNRLTSKTIKQGKALGYKLRTTKAGREFFVKPGAVELLKYLKESGYTVLVSSRSHEEYAKDVTSSCELSQYLDGVAGMEQLLDKRNQDFKKHPKHANNIGWWNRLKGYMRWLFIKIPKALFTKVRSLFNKHIVNYMPTRPARLNKYPPLLSKIILGDNAAPAHWIIDNEFEENKKYAAKAGDYAVVDPGEFFGAKKLKINDNGEYEWVARVKQALAKGWRQHYQDIFAKSAST